MLKARESSAPFSLVKNQYISLVVFDPDSGKLNLQSRVESVLGDNLTLHWPTTAMGARYFFPDVRFAVIQLLLGPRVISFKVDITPAMLRQHDERLLTIRLPRFWDRLEQKRRFHRVRQQFEVQFRLLGEEGYSQKLFEAQASDISVGGMEISSTELLEATDLLELSFTLQFYDFHGVVARVLRRGVEPGDANLMYRYSLEFQGMFERERDTLQQLLMRSIPPLPVPRILPGA